jgi:nitrite reductase/ring-hydroxylating ferredoxin subunit
MNKILTLLVFLFLLSCEKNQVSSNPYLSNVSFSIDINTNLPDFDALKFPSNPKLITSAGAGVQGIIVMKTGGGDSYVAWEASCPNQYPTSCSRLSISGINAVCSCDDFSYNLFTGDGGKEYGLKFYRTEVLGNIIRVYN